jgi:DNA-binding XRE family transcriptional regulator
MKTKPNASVRALRIIIRKTQAEFAAMIGASKDTVISWECGRNELSLEGANKIFVATGVDTEDLLFRYAPTIGAWAASLLKCRPGEPYTREHFERYRKASGSEAVQKRMIALAQKDLALLYRAAARPGAGKLKDRLPNLHYAFLTWAREVVEAFNLDPQIDELVPRGGARPSFEEVE